MRTSEQIYHRIRWDSRFDPARFVVGVDMHRAEPKRVPLSSFVPGGDIPWHRVIFFEADGEVVWSRRTGADRLDETLAGRVRAPQRLRPPFFTPRAPVRWDAGASRWAQAEAETASSAPPALRVVTWNTLWDRYDAERIDTARRRPLLIDALERIDADVIALQEVEPALLAMLLDAPWVRARYTLSDGPEGRDVDRCGVLVMSRCPVLEVGWHALGPYKAVVAMTIALEPGPIVIAATHLTSDHAREGARKRVEELEQLANGLGSVEGGLVLLGDFNDGGPGPAATLGMRDAWSEVHGEGDATPTFDPTVNPLAAISSLSGRASRLDRVLVRGASLRVTGAALEGTQAVGGLFLSDHWGVRAELGAGAGEGETESIDVAPTSRTALAWLPPESLWPPIQALRQHHDPQFERWPPHVNVVFGFVPEAAFEAAAPLLSAAAREVAPFRAALEGVRSFEHASGSTVWLDPAAADAEPWARLRDALARRLPRCRAREAGFTPHLTLGKTGDPEHVRSAWQARLGRVEAEVGELALLSRRGDEPMEVRATVALGTGEVRWVIPRAADPRAEARPDQARAIASRIEAALPGAVVHVTGSMRLGCALDGADVDLVAAIPGAGDADAIEARLRAALPSAEGWRRVHAVRMPGIELRLGGLDVDLALVGVGEIPPAQAVARRGELDDAAAIALSAASDADALLAAVGDRREAFLALAREVKAWARARGLGSAPFGGLPGLAWLVLAARVVRDARELEPAALRALFFGTWAAWDWREPVSLEGVSVGAETDAMRIATPTAPVRSCSDQVGAAGAAVIAEELYAAWELAERGDDDALFAPPALHRRHAAWAVITVEVSEPTALAGAVGRMRGRVRALLGAIERAGVEDVRPWPRPFASSPRIARFAIGLGARPIDADVLAKTAEPWAKDLRGVRVEWAEGGAVPTLR